MDCGTIQEKVKNMIIFGFDLTPYLPFIYALITGIAWATYGWITSTSNNDFSKIKYLSTVCTSLLVVTVMWEAQIPLDQVSFEQQMITYAAFTVGLERLFNKILDYFSKKPIPAQARPQGVMNPAITFTAAPITGKAPLAVLFTDTSGLITYWLFGDNTIGNWDFPGQTALIHDYKTAGTFTVYGMQNSSTMSNPMTITVTGAPIPPPVVKKSWLELLIAWILGIFGK